MARGHLVKRAADSWSIVIELDPDPVTGKRKQKWVTVKGTKKNAEEELTRLLRQKDTGKLIADPSTWTLGEFLHHWLTAYAAQNCRPKTQAGYRGLIERLIIPMLGEVKLGKLTAAQVREMYSKLLTEGRPGGRPLSARTVHHTHRVLKEALTHGVKWQIIPRNVAEAVDPPKPERKEMQVWNADEVRPFLSTVTATDENGEEVAHYGAAMAFALETGVRQSEVIGLRWQDVDLTRGTAQIRQTIQRVPNRGLVVGQPKTSRGRRQIALTPATVELLRAHKARQNAIRLMLGAGWQDQDLVFCTSLGTPANPMTLYKAFLPACDKAGVRRISFHSLRHTHATLLLSQNVHAKIVSERLGHASIGITLDTYSHVLPGMQDAAVRQLEALLRPAGGTR